MSPCRRSCRECKSHAKVAQRIQFEATDLDRKTVFAIPRLPPLMLTLSSTERYFSYSFFVFLSRHLITGSSGRDCADLRSLVQGSASLQYTVVALSSLSINSSERRSSSAPGSRTSLSHYQQAVSSLRLELRKLDEDNAPTTDSTLWVTLLLSIFELMYDTSGSGFNLHFVQGTFTLLRCKSTAYFMQRRKRPFLRLARAFDVLRAVAYWDNPHFEDAPRRDAIDDTVVEGDPLGGSSALEAMYKIVGAFANLKASAKSTVQSTHPQDLAEAQRTFLQ